MTATTHSETRPTLWNPNAAACWSLLFTPAFGAYLHARNADALGRSDEAKANRVFFCISLIYSGFVLLSVFITAIPDSIYKGAAIGLLIGWYFVLGKKQIQHVKETWPTGYDRKPLTKPLFVALGCLVVYLIVIISLGVIEESFFGIT